MSAKLGALGLLKIKVFWKKDYYIKISDYGVTIRVLSRDSNYIVDVAMWPKFGNPSISMWEFIMTSILQGFHQINYFLRGFLSSDLGLEVIIA